MTVTRLFAGETVYHVSGAGYAPDGAITTEAGVEAEQNPLLNRLLEIAVLCNEAELQESDGVWSIIGDPTEGAMLTVAAKFGVTRDALSEQYPRKGDMPFDSDRKMMSVFHDEFTEGKLSLTKGAPDIILDRCANEMTSDGVRPMTDQRRRAIMETNSAFAQTALRIGVCIPRAQGRNGSGAEEEMTFVGLME